MDKNRIIHEDDLTYIIRDAYPITKGHTLIIPKRHVESFDQISVQELQEMMLDSLYKAKLEIDLEYSPDGYNIGINDGAVAGQTVNHLHLHIIPRYKGDCPDPRGGIRWIMPNKAKYWRD
jgi:diadenosine tetraphosphate (Ap4A) HIT family hydrolase